MALSHGAMGLSAVCDCAISWSYSLTFLVMIRIFNFGNTWRALLFTLLITKVHKMIPGYPTVVLPVKKGKTIDFS